MDGFGWRLAGSVLGGRPGKQQVGALTKSDTRQSLD